MTVSMELFLEVYSAFCEEELPEAATVEGILRSYVNDYCQDMMEQRIREGVDPELDFAADIIMNSDIYCFLFCDILPSGDLSPCNACGK